MSNGVAFGGVAVVDIMVCVVVAVVVEYAMRVVRCAMVVGN